VREILWIIVGLAIFALRRSSDAQPASARQ